MGKQPKILYVSHPQKECGVYQFGKRIGKVLQSSAAFQFIYVECADEHELCQAVTETKPAAIIYNYHPSTLPWLNIHTTRQFSCPQLGTLHEVTQSLADSADNTLFNYHIAPDPTLLLKNPIVFKTGRLVTAFHNKFPLPTTTTIGSFGFGVSPAEKASRYLPRSCKIATKMQSFAFIYRIQNSSTQTVQSASYRGTLFFYVI